MTSLDDLKDVLKDTLDNRGVLNQIRARIRAEVFSALDDQTEPKPILSNENLFINELIREYFEFNKYKYTTSVLIAESGQPKDPIDRQFLTSELNIQESASSEKVPILYGLVSCFLDQKLGGEKEKERKLRSKKSSPTSKSVPKKKISLNSTDGSHEEAPKSKGIVYHAPR